MNDDEINSRRRAILLGLLGVGGLACAPVIELLSERELKVVEGLLTRRAHAAELDALSSLFSADSIVQVVAGKTNNLAAHAGGEGLSPYLRASADYLGGFLREATGDEGIYREVKSESLHLQHAKGDSVALGGPVANPFGAVFTGHDFAGATGTKGKLQLPIFNQDYRLRWGFFCGDGSYGNWRGEQRTAKRYENSEVVQRPLYGIWDVAQSRSKPIPYQLDSGGFLTEEALLINRAENPHAKGKTVSVIGGVHGYSALAFFADLEHNLFALKNLVGASRDYQVMVPAKLLNDHNSKTTIASLDWSSASTLIRA